MYIPIHEMQVPEIVLFIHKAYLQINQVEYLHESSRSLSTIPEKQNHKHCHYKISKFA